MARPPLIFDTPVGKFYALDMGGGVCALVIHGDEGAQSYPLDAAMALRLQAWLSSGVKRRTSPSGSTIDYQMVADLYQSDDAAEYQGGRQKYVAAQLDISAMTASGRIVKARELGLITAVYRDRENSGTDD